MGHGAFGSVWVRLLEISLPEPRLGASFMALRAKSWESRSHATTCGGALYARSPAMLKAENESEDPQNVA